MMHDYVREYIRAIDQPLPELAKTFDSELKFLKSYCSKDTLVLDVGCGAARPATTLAPFVKKITSIDHNQAMIDLATGRSEGIENIEIKKDDALDMSFGDESFDLVYDTYNLIGSLEKNERQKLVNEMTRVAKKGGKVMNIVWKDNVETTDFLRKYYPAIGIEVLNISEAGTITSKGTFDRFTRDELKEFHENAGLKNIQFTDVGPVWMAIVGEK
jgi:ubiquinone/menaquinone biosynthesis C-methylase UbiE